MFQHLKFLDPHIAAYEQFSSLFPLTERFPNIIIYANDQQLIHEEYLQIKLDSRVQNLLASSSHSTVTVDTDKFWTNVYKLTDINNKLKFDNLCVGELS